MSNLACFFIQRNKRLQRLRLLTAEYKYVFLFNVSEYSSSLISSLTVPSLTKMLQTREEIYKMEGAYFFMQYGTSSYNLYKSQSFPIYEKMWNKINEICPIICITDPKADRMKLIEQYENSFITFDYTPLNFQSIYPLSKEYQRVFSEFSNNRFENSESTS